MADEGKRRDKRLEWVRLQFSNAGIWLVLIGILSVIASQAVGGELLRAALSGMGGAMIGSGGSMLLDARSKGEALTAIEQAKETILSEVKAAVMKSTEHYGRFGLYDIHAPANGHDYTRMIAGAETLTLVFNDMRRWLPNHGHLAALRERIRDKKPTRIYILHPDNPMLPFVARISNKIQIDPSSGGVINRQITDIELAIRQITAGFSLADMSALTFLGHHHVNTYTVVMSEKEALVVNYPVAKRYNDGVIWHFHAGSGSENEYRTCQADIEELDRETRDLGPTTDLRIWTSRNAESGARAPGKTDTG